MFNIHSIGQTLDQYFHAQNIFSAICHLNRGHFKVRYSDKSGFPVSGIQIVTLFSTLSLLFTTKPFFLFEVGHQKTPLEQILKFAIFSILFIIFDKCSIVGLDFPLLKASFLVVLGIFF